jgi:hypothetical protein
MEKKIVGLMVALLVVVGIFIFKDEVEVETFETQVYVEPSEDVINQFGQLSVLGYDWISENIQWIDEDMLKFEGRRSGEQALYQLNIKSLALSKLNDDVRNGNKLIYKGDGIKVFEKSDDSNLYVYEDGEERLVANKGSFDLNALFLVSDNEDKLGYYDPSASSVVAYDVSSLKYRKLSYEGESDDVRTISDFSPDGGFISFSERAVAPFESRFSILGADSGKVYGKEIKGIEPTFDPNSKTVAFIYSGEMDDHYGGGKIGLFRLKNKKITYLDTLMLGENILPRLGWSSDSSHIYAVTKTQEETYMFNAFNVQSGSRRSLVFEGGNYKYIDEIVVDQDMAYIVFEHGNLCELDMKSGRYNWTSGLLKFDGGAHIRQLNSGDYLIFTDTELRVLTGSGYRLIASYEGSVKGIYMSPNQDSICFLLESGEEIFLRVADLIEKS